MKLDLTILIIHYDRINCLNKSLGKLYDAFGDSVKYIIGDDNTPEHKLKPIIDKFDVRIERLAKNSGLGANINNAITRVDTKYVLQIQDDHYLKDGVDHNFLKYGIECLEHNKDIDMIRFLLPYNLNIKENRFIENLKVSLINNNIFKNSPYPFYIYSDWPHLRSLESYNKFGRYVENKPVGVTELAYGMNLIINEGIIAYFEDFRNIFEHNSSGLTYNQQRSYISKRIPEIKNLSLVKSYLAYFYMKTTGTFPFFLY